MTISPLIIAPDHERFVEDAAALIAAAIRGAIDERDRCTIALSGGSTPGPVYTRLAGLPSIDWSKVIIMLADERCVPMTSAESTQGMIIETLLKRLPVRPLRFVVPDTRLDPEPCAEDYALQVEDVLDVDPLDCCVLGMGDDGHIASLFPPLSELAQSALTAFHAEQEMFAVRDRISLTLPVLASARSPLLLLSGAKKKAAWDEMRASPEGQERWPFKAVLAGRKARVVAQW